MYNETWPILYSQKVVDFINSVSDRVEIRWHTTWQWHAIVTLAPKIGLNKFELAETYEFNSTYNWWKIPTAEKVVLEEKRPLIWTDDDIWIYQRDFLHIKAKDSILIAPSTTIGLTPKQLKKIESFISDHEIKES